jgi:hypothetical protein
MGCDWLLTFVLYVSLPTVTAHSWVEQVSVIASNGTFVGDPGYPRGFVNRSEPDFSGHLMLHHINALDNGVFMCRDSQRQIITSALAVSQVPIGKPPQTGMEYVYGTA